MDLDTELLEDEPEDITEPDLSFLRTTPEPKLDDKPAVNVSLDTKAIADALSQQNDVTARTIREVGRELLGGLRQESQAAPKRTKEQIAARNLQIMAVLSDATGDVDIEEQIAGFMAPIIESRIKGAVDSVRPQADNVAIAQGERIVNDFRRDLKASVNEKAHGRFDKIMDELIPESLYSRLATATPAERKAFFAEKALMAKGKYYEEAVSEKAARGSATGNGGGGSRTPEELSFLSLSKEDQREATRMAEAYCRREGLKSGTPEWNKMKAEKVKDWMDA